MSAIAGLYNLNGAPVDPEQIDCISSALAHRGPDGEGVWLDEAIGFAHRLLHTTIESTRERQPLEFAGLVLVSDSRIDNRDELCAKLGIQRQSDITDTELILHSYRKWGRKCAEMLIGDFVFALWDQRERVVYCARDPMGVKPFYYFHSERLFAFASEAKALLKLSDIPRDLDEVHLCRYLVAELDEREGTFYKSVRRLPAAHMMVVSPTGIDRRAYWKLDPNREVRLSNSDEYAEAFREIFTEAVRARTRSIRPVAATLSGGLDSSSIVCIGNQLLRQGEAPQIIPISLVFPELPADALRLIDERSYVESVARSTGLEPRYLRGDRLSPLAAIERLLWHLDEPHLASNAYLHWALYAEASRSNARVILDGLDGDTTVGHGFGRLAALAETGDWSTFEREVRAYAHNAGMKRSALLRRFAFPQLGQLARQGSWGRWLRAARELKARFGLSFGTVAMRGGLMPILPWLVDAWRIVRWKSGVESSILAPRFQRRCRSEAKLDPQRSPSDPVTSERIAHWRGMTQPLYQLTLEIADKCAAAFQVEPRYPFFDRRLMEFCLAIPSEQKFADGWGRLIMRRAMEGILPSDVQWRGIKANLAPNFHHRFRAVDRPVVEGIEQSALGRYVNPRTYRRVQRRYFAAENASPQDPDGPLLFRTTVLGIWLEKCGMVSSSS